MNVLPVVGTIVITFELTCLVQAMLHRFIGHRRVIVAIFRRHTQSHHFLYSKLTFEQRAYREDEESVSHMMVPIAVLIAYAAYCLLPLPLFIVSSTTVLLTCVAHAYLHTHFHLAESPLRRFGWFRRLKALHCVHHVDQSTNFGVVTLVWDRVMGTFAPGALPSEPRGSA